MWIKWLLNGKLFFFFFFLLNWQYYYGLKMLTLVTYFHKKANVSSENCASGQMRTKKVLMMFTFIKSAISVAP